MQERNLKFSSYEENELFSIIAPICEGYRAQIVQLNSAVVKTSLQVRIVLYKKGGINIDTCTEISRAVMPRIEVWADNRDVNLEVSSPGVGRTLKDAYEFQVFTGEKINILTGDQWLSGTVVSADSTGMILGADGSEKEYSFDQIQKAKLD